jgi:hypothetical protein
VVAILKEEYAFAEWDSSSIAHFLNILTRDIGVHVGGQERETNIYAAKSTSRIFT